LDVSDTGAGIPEEAQAAIFEPFSQVDSSVTRAYGGSGLGLSIVRELTKLMGGETTLTSQIGQGTTFTVTLPVLTSDQII
ncbi:MAG: ATP-binding protein, partial [Anaerolineales bacterium]